jgi:tRNA(Ile)-lysidine synthetase-like protein|uniref:tRNA(Ile)-lysidine synthetase n=1 Tax=viral metagenome TaxID=1070528 RepID=A0A6C0JNT1_9ZZZZ
MVIDILLELYNDWFNNKDWWFSKNEKVDTYLSDKYIGIIKDDEKFDITKYDSKIQLACVILLDQIPRHYKRIYNNNYDVFNYSKKATTICNYLIINNNINDFTIDELSFLYLPYRHIYDINMICKIINIFIYKYNNSDNSDNSDKNKCKKYIYNTLNNSFEYINLLSYDNKLEFKHFDNIDKNIFCQKSLEKYNYLYENKDSNIYKTIYNNFIKLKKNATIIVSLSGGVDSIVSLFILKDIINNSKIKCNLIALHINYNNRSESKSELDFVNYYCNLLNVKLIFRTIFEINRNMCMNNGLRDLYEDITKKIRLDMYKYGFLSNNTVYVLLGHNKDDCFENIITNIANNNNYENLSGMEIITKIDNINYWRPMLDILKNEIISFANNNNIPYLKDSTPKWSARGKIRDIIRPALCNLKNSENIISAFFDLKDHLKNSNNLINDLVLNNLVEKFNNNYSYSKNELNSFKYINISTLFFKKINIKISFKAIKEFCYYIENVLNNTSRKKIILSKCYNISLIKKDENSYYIQLHNN